MQELIYYPGFEVRDQDWLKFALLYIDKLAPIVPLSGDEYLTKDFEKLRNETDLILFHRPSDSEGVTATLDAIDAVEKIMRHPRAYRSISYDDNIVEKWQYPGFHLYRLFEEKYTSEWEEFCMENGFATRNRGALHIPRELGYIYMTMLAQAIADKLGVSPITDYPDMDKFAILNARVRGNVPHQNRVSLAQAEISLVMPNLKQVSLDQIIKFRQRPEFKQNLAAFHEELDANIKKLEAGQNLRESMGGFLGDYGATFVVLAAGLVEIALDVWFALDQSLTSPLPVVPLIGKSSAFAIAGSVEIVKTWKHTKSKRLTKKYLADLQKLDWSVATISKLAAVVATK